MTRPQRATPARKLTRSPEPRRPLLWSIEERIRSVPGVFFATFHDWQCLLCASGTGQAPTHQQADNDAHIHWRANHNHQEATTWPPNPPSPPRS